MAMSQTDIDRVKTAFDAVKADMGRRLTTTLRGAVNGVAELDASRLIPTNRLGTGTADAATILYGNRTWGAAPAGGGSVAGAVLFDSAQSLTDAQASQARANIDVTDPRPSLPQSWAFFGDSITNIGEGYPFYAQVLSRGRIVAQYVQSNPGQDSTYLLSVIDAQVINQNPRPGTCLILCGANDAQSATTIATFKANVQAMVAKLRRAGIRPVIGTVPPNNNGTADTLVRTYNAWLSRWALNAGVPLVDFYEAVIGPNGWLAEYDSGDGLHPSPAGNAALGQAVIDAVGGMLTTGNYVVQPRDGAPNMQTNSTFTVDTNADGIPDGMWSNATNISTVADVDGSFRWLRVTVAGQAATATVNSEELTVAGGHFVVGDALRFSALVRSGQDTTQNLAGLELHVTCFNDVYAVMSDYMLASWNGGLSRQVDGAVIREFTVPAGTTKILWNLVGGPQDGTYDVALPTFVNLTARGCL